ncbi:multidrug efflux RND transporter permease subunit [Methylocystis sp. MJC1]|jgi:hydrophobe/amphiphile efflux-1 (HAE1) family protein|uniref:efflux RND transporter permease subunit n=1 Tax=Methylocystis sp. MJC1 TaxID=2654282 RepID=UPI0013EB3F6C|nr:multidrug efflux RND transporter permease subunit [Methylocystis sp. MJC1]KAF2989179.1 Efflux pump membrane transporter BepE [Methylocystis sp. MJC1]MBU6525867.1 multidrug efflux RND transporter permease subunit [Methylocystis sp. MJC1]UZX12334.1 multidrug efflux RND transporter permease subunit [Methylocystis sp. MJC1]
MRFPHFFIERPIFAAVISVLLTIAGLIAQRALPVSEYPDIAPPTVMITATYPGASAEVIAQTVASPIEQEVNGVDDMLYIVSQSTGDGLLTINVVFKTGVNIDLAQVLVQNRVAIATPRLPEEVQRFGVVVKKASPDLMMVVHLRSPDGSRSQQYISNYATLYVRDELARLEGVGDVRVFGARDYSMRVWLDPDKVAARGMTAGEVVAALRAANLQVAAGAINQPPAASPGAFQLSVRTLGRLSDPAQFADVVLRADADGQVRLRDVARVEIGAQDYTVNAYLDRDAATAIAIFQKPGSNALATSAAVEEAMVQAKKQFPAGLDYSIVYNPTEFIQQSVDEVVRTLGEAIILVVLVVILFLQTWRAAIIPVVAIPISLVGSFAVMKLVGLTFNTLSLFGLVLAIGIVVDDAIVVVENVERYLAQGMTPKEAAHKTMDEVGGALIAIALVLCAVFIPVAYITGLQGAFYKQFAITIASATLISAFVSLTLSPALAAILLKPHGEEHAAHAGRFEFLRHPLNAFFARFNRLFDAMSARYGALTARLVRVGLASLVVYGLLIALAAGLLWRTPTGLVPTLDRGYLIAAFQLPPGAALDRTDSVMRQATNIILSRPGVASSVVFTGFDGATFTNAPNAGVIFVTLKSFEERHRAGLTAPGIRDDIRAALAPIKDAFVFVLEPPAVPGIGTGGGIKGYVQDRGGMGLPALEGAAWSLAGPAMHTPGVAQAFTLFNTRTPQIFADVDRTKAEMIGVPITRVFETMSIYLGSVFVNDFNILGRTYRVMAQADNPHRLTLRDLSELKTRSATGEMTPLGALASFNDTTGPFRVPRYNLYPAAEVQVNLQHGVSSGQGIAMIEGLASKSLPQGFGFQWTEIALQEKLAGNTAILAFGLAVVFVFLLLAALYESVVLPLAVILIVPMCILAAMSGVAARGLDRNILVEIGLVVLIGLAAKNAILIVEFARQGENEGKDRFTAAIEAARTRLRPILMTSLAFILGVLPLAVSHGAGAEMRQSLGVAVFSGMIGVTIFGLLFTPIFYVLSRALGIRSWRP